MSRPSISFTEPNDQWLKSQVESKEYTNKSQVVIDLIKQKIVQAENSGFTEDSQQDILNQARKSVNGWLQLCLPH